MKFETCHKTSVHLIIVKVLNFYKIRWYNATYVGETKKI